MENIRCVYVNKLNIFTNVYPRFKDRPQIILLVCLSRTKINTVMLDPKSLIILKDKDLWLIVPFQVSYATLTIAVYIYDILLTKVLSE